MLDQLHRLIPLSTVVLVQIVGLLMLTLDNDRMIRSDMHREATFSRTTARVYMIGSALAWLVLRVTTAFIQK